MRLLEKRQVEQTFYDGAQLNHFLARSGVGRVFGLTLSNTSQQILISAGLLIARGYRVSFENETLMTFDSYPVQNETINLILRITVTQDDSYISITTGAVTHMDEIEKGVGSYDYLLATFIVGPDGIVEITPQIRDLKVSGGGGGGIGTVIESRNMTEGALVSLMRTLNDDIYSINTQLYGDEFLFVQKRGQQIARYTGTGASYQYDNVNHGWVLQGGNNGGGTVWISGTEITGTGDNILSYDMTLYGKCKIGDIYRNNDTQNIYICTYKDTEKTAWKYESNIKGGAGDSVHIRFSSYPDGTNFSANWDNSKAYMGVAVAQAAPAVKTGYTWTKFIGTYVDISDDAAATSIMHNLTDNTDKTYKATGISQLTINIPSAVYHGFYAGVNFKVGASVPTVSFVNNSAYPLKSMLYGITISSYSPRQNCAVNMSFICDGINLYCYISEV